MARLTNNRWAGLSLMEAIVVVGVMTIIMFIVTQIFIINYDLFLKQSKRTDNETGAVTAARTVSQMARGAVSVEQSHGFDGDLVVSSSTALVLKLPSIDGSGNIVPNTYDYVGFYRDATETNKMFAIIDADDASVRVDSDRLITNYNQMLDFRYNNPTITEASRISIYILNQQIQKDIELNTRGWTSIFLRNY